MADDLRLKAATTRIVYAVVLGQRGGDLLGPAGDAALALASSAIDESSATSPSRRARSSVRIGFGQHVVPFGLARQSHVYLVGSTTSPPLDDSLRHLDGDDPPR